MEKLTGKGIPSNHLVGEVGQWYEDTNTGDIYECRIANKYSTLHGAPVGGYVWERRAKGEDVRELYGSGSSGVTSWNDLTDKPFGETEGETITLIENKAFSLGRTTTINDKSVNTYFVGVWGIITDDNKIPPYGTINIVINGVTYSSPVKIGNEGHWIYAGNKKLLNANYEDTGENFCLQISPYEDALNLDYTLYTVDEPVSVTLPNGNIADGAVISIEQDTSVVNTIDPKFIPSTIARVGKTFYASDDNTLYHDSSLTDGVTIADVDSILGATIVIPYDSGSYEKYICCSVHTNGAVSGFRALVISSSGSQPYTSVDYEAFNP